MIEASKDMHFERAAKLRDEIKALDALGKRAEQGRAGILAARGVRHQPAGRRDRAAGSARARPSRRGSSKAIDIAHLQGGEMVGSKVCFIDGVPFKDGYRRYKIKHGQGNNDYSQHPGSRQPPLPRGRDRTTSCIPT